MNCKICTNSYTERNKPKVLPCGHSLCNDCLYQIYQTESISCPFCKNPIVDPIDAIPVNYDVLECLGIILKTKPLPSVKIVILGDIAVGKTSLAHAFKTKEKYTSKEVTTLSLDIFPVTMKMKNGQNVLVELWDTPGSTDWNLLCKLHYRSAYASIIVFDLSNVDTFKGCQKWYETIYEINPMLPVILIANKCDKPAKEHKISDAQISKFVEKHPNIKAWKKASSVEYININESLALASQEAYNYKQKYNIKESNILKSQISDPKANGCSRC
jgi:small GTP-binding protein